MRERAAEIRREERQRKIQYMADTVDECIRVYLCLKERIEEKRKGLQAFLFSSETITS